MRKDEKYNDVPGPGSYNAKNDLTKYGGSQSMRLSSAKRTTFMEQVGEDKPGPGNYDSGSTFANAKGFTIGTRKDQKYNDVPGPGSYRSDSEITKPSQYN